MFASSSSSTSSPPRTNVQTCYTASGAFHFGFTQQEVDEKIATAVAAKEAEWQIKQDELQREVQRALAAAQDRQAALQTELGAAKERATFYEASAKKHAEIIEELTNRLYRSETEKRKMEQEEQLQMGLLQNAVKGVQQSYTSASSKDPSPATTTSSQSPTPQQQQQEPQLHTQRPAVTADDIPTYETAED